MFFFTSFQCRVVMCVYLLVDMQPFIPSHRLRCNDIITVWGTVCVCVSVCVCVCVCVRVKQSNLIKQ